MSDWLNEGPGRMSHLRQQREEAIRICRDVYGGTLRMREERTRYLPRFPKEDPQVYEARVNAAVLFNMLERTVGGLAGMVLRKPPTADGDVDKTIAEHHADIDRAGRSISMFANDGLSEAYVDGHSIIIVDMPRIDTARTRDEVGDVRPYWYLIRADDVLGFEHERRDGKGVVTALRWRDSMIERDAADEFMEKEVPLVKEFRLVQEVVEGSDRTRSRVQWREWRLKTDTRATTKAWVPVAPPELMGEQMDEIPLSVIYTKRKGVLDSKPPLLDLATENVRHFQKLSDKDNYEHVSCVSIFTLIGAEDEVKNFTVGPTVGLSLPKDSDAKYVETNGEGSSATADSLKASEHRMALLGLSMLHSESRSAETATSKRIDKSESDSQLATSAESLEVALNNAGRLHAKWLGLEEGAAGKVSVNRDFENIRLDAQMITALAALVPAKMTLETFWDLMKQGEILPDTFDPAVERQRLEDQDVEMLAQLRQVMAGQRNGSKEGNEGNDE